MPRLYLLVSAASLLLLAGCASDRYDSESRDSWRMSNQDGEIDYEMLDAVLFRNDSAELSDRAARVIEDLAEEARHHPGAPIVVDGYTDTTGSNEHNLTLSHERAESVADALMQAGVNGRRIETHGFGETRLAVPTGDDVSERKNRRVVVRLMGA